MTSDGEFLTVAIINADESTQEIDLSLKGIALSGKRRMWRMTGDSLTAATGFGRNEVRIVESSPTETPKALAVARISIEIYAFAKLELVVHALGRSRRRPQQAVTAHALGSVLYLWAL